MSNFSHSQTHENNAFSDIQLNENNTETSNMVCLIVVNPITHGIRDQPWLTGGGYYSPCFEIIDNGTFWRAESQNFITKLKYKLVMTFRNFPQLSKLKIVDFKFLVKIWKSQVKKIQKKKWNFKLQFRKKCPLWKSSQMMKK